jgi:hypothetical protein
VTTLEFKPPGSFEPINGMVGGSVWAGGGRGISVPQDDASTSAGVTWVDMNGKAQPVAPEDTLMGVPYNEQVVDLQSRPPNGVTAGTVDKFQGQEAPVSSTAWRRRPERGTKGYGVSVQPE